MPRPNPNLRDFWLQRTVNGNQVRFRVLYGGRDSSKTWDTAARAMWLSHKGQLRICCTRMYQNRIEESVYTTIDKQIKRFGFSPYFNIQRSKIYSSTGSEFVFYGLARNVEEIKGLEGIDILWIEEGHNLTKDMWDELEPTIRKEDSEIWIVFNPQYATDFVWQRFIINTPENALVRKVNYPDNPFLSEVSKDTIQRRKEEDYNSYEHIYLGVPKEDDEAVIIKRKWVQAAVDAHKVLGIDVSGTRKIGYDPADGNEEGTADNNAMAMRYGVLIEDTEEWQAGEDELMKSTKRVYNKAVGENYRVVYDPIGVGAAVGSKIQEINSDRELDVQYSSFNAGGEIVDPEKEYMPKTKNKDHFSNLKAQAWWLLADRFRDTYNAVKKGHDFQEDEIISISSDCNNLEKLISELSAPKRDYDKAGRVKVESKSDLLKRGVKSPNLADSVVMAFAPQKAKRGSLSPQMANV